MGVNTSMLASQDTAQAVSTASHNSTLGLEVVDQAVELGQLKKPSTVAVVLAQFLDCIYRRQGHPELS